MKTIAIHKAAAMVVLGLLATSVMAVAADLKQNTVSAFDKYVAATERRMSLEVDPGGQFLYVDSLPASEMASAYERLRHGEILVELMKTTASGLDYEIPEGVVHHWVGVIFIPGATLEQTRAVAQDYDHRAQLYQPEVIAAHVISHEGDDYRIFMRLYEKRFTTVVFNTEYAIHWGQVDERTMYSNSMSTRIAEVKDPNNPEGPDLPVGTGNGYLWRLNTYWRFQEKDGGVYIQCEAVSLTRDIPFGLGWLLRPLVTKIPKQSLTRTLGRTREVVLERK
jgi:hypothetical protein